MYSFQSTLNWGDDVRDIVTEEVVGAVIPKLIRRG